MLFCPRDKRNIQVIAFSCELILLKIACGKLCYTGNGISETLTLKTSGIACPQTSLQWAAFGATTFLPLVCKPTNRSHAAPLTTIYRKFLYEITVVCADCLLPPVAVTAVIMASSSINKLRMMISWTSSRHQICQKLLS